AVSKSNCIIIFINQLREKVGVMYGNPETTTGGRALKFYASMRIDVRKIEQLKASGNEFVGSRTRAKIVKNKVAPPFKEAEFDIIYGRGIAKEGEILDAAVSLDIIHKSGAWFSYGDERLGQGRENVKEYLLNNPDFMADIESQVKARISELSNQMKASYKGGQMHDTPVAAPAADPAPEAAPVQTSAASAKAKLDITVDD
ncbi:MAG: DNA recombination/repair protein RecA, partial [Clostridia bacterium]|nr:DNA recombination/repair protein RecA [Clostridia bacterium]